MDYQPTRLEILKLIEDQGVVWIETLRAEVGYTYWGAVSKLKRLYKAGLIEPLYTRGLNQGRYVLSVRGHERLDYLMEAEESKQQAEKLFQLRENELRNKIERLEQRVRELEKELLIKMLNRRADRRRP